MLQTWHTTQESTEEAPLAPPPTPNSAAAALAAAASAAAEYEELAEAGGTPLCSPTTPLSQRLLAPWHPAAAAVAAVAAAAPAGGGAGASDDARHGALSPHEESAADLLLLSARACTPLVSGGCFSPDAAELAGSARTAAFGGGVGSTSCVSPVDLPTLLLEERGEAETVYLGCPGDGLDAAPLSARRAWGAPPSQLVTPAGVGSARQQVKPGRGLPLPPAASTPDPFAPLRSFSACTLLVPPPQSRPEMVTPSPRKRKWSPVPLSGDDSPAAAAAPPAAAGAADVGVAAKVARQLRVLAGISVGS